MTHPRGAITDLQHLQNIVLIGGTVWYVPCRGISARDCHNLKIRKDSDCTMLVWHDGSVQFDLIHLPEQKINPRRNQYKSMATYIFESEDEANAWGTTKYRRQYAEIFRVPA